jgi:hypothetical protein
MKPPAFHLTDEELLQSADGELSAKAASRVQSHMAECWSCRSRMRTIEESVAEFTRAHHESLDPRVPPPEGPRALLSFQMSKLSSAGGRRQPKHRWTSALSWQLAGACIAIIGLSAAVVVLIGQSQKSANASIVSVPQPSLTPGAVVMRSREEVCSAEPANNRVVPVSVRSRVFEEYGISKTDTRAYEVDYLITPALGGSDDIHNLWPQSYSATVWNAHVKDALEQYLRSLVCAGDLDLATAQREISQDWIAAYKKHFHTDRPREISQ